MIKPKTPFEVTHENQLLRAADKQAYAAKQKALRDELLEPTLEDQGTAERVSCHPGTIFVYSSRMLRQYMLDIHRTLPRSTAQVSLKGLRACWLPA